MPIITVTRSHILIYTLYMCAKCDMRFRYAMWKDVECRMINIAAAVNKPKCIYVCCVQCVQNVCVQNIHNLVQSCVGGMSNILSHNGFIVSVVDAARTYMYIVYFDARVWRPLQCFWLFVCWHHCQPNVNLIIKHQTDFYLSFYSFSFFIWQAAECRKQNLLKERREKKFVSVHLFIRQHMKRCFSLKFATRKLLK